MIHSKNRISAASSFLLFCLGLPTISTFQVDCQGIYLPLTLLSYLLMWLLYYLLFYPLFLLLLLYCYVQFFPYTAEYFFHIISSLSRSFKYLADAIHLSKLKRHFLSDFPIMLHLCFISYQIYFCIFWCMKSNFLQPVLQTIECLFSCYVVC